MLWDFCAWVGIATLGALGLCLVYGVVRDIQVSRVGWTKMGELGFWRSVVASCRPLPWRINWQDRIDKPKPNVMCACGDLINECQPSVEVEADGVLWHGNADGGGHRADYPT